MLTITKQRIPIYLRSSQLYCSLESCNVEEEEEMTIPSNCCKTDEHIKSAYDLEHYARTIRYWGMNDIPTKLIEFAFSDIDCSWDSTVSEFGGELLYLIDLSYIRKLPPCERIIAAVRCGCMEIVKYLYEQGYITPSDVCTIASGAGQLKCLEYFVSQGYPISSNCSLMAAKCGSIPCLQYLATVANSFSVLECVFAAEGGSVQCLQYLLDNGSRNSDAYYAAVKNGHLACIVMLHQYEIPFPSNIFNTAARYGQYDCLKFFVGASGDNAVFNNSDTFALQCAIQRDSVDCFSFLHEYGCALSLSLSTLCARMGSIGCLKYAHEHGCPWDARTSSAAAVKGHLHCLMYMHENGCPWDESTVCAASQNPSPECLQYAHEHGCPWDEGACRAAVRFNRLTCLQYLLQNGCPFGKRTFSVVRTIPILQLLLNHISSRVPTTSTDFATNSSNSSNSSSSSNSFLSHKICINAVIDNNVELLKYATELGAPWSYKSKVCVCRVLNSRCLSDQLEQYIIGSTCRCNRKTLFTEDC